MQEKSALPRQRCRFDTDVHGYANRRIANGAILRRIYHLYIRKNPQRKEVIRKIPVSPMLQRIRNLIDFEKAVSTNIHCIRDALKRVFPNRHPHELRYTFITRAKECGCNPEAVMLWVGHEHDRDVRTSKVDRGYTTYSEEYLFAEIKKINYDYP